jgi:hypothetical protein
MKESWNLFLFGKFLVDTKILFLGNSTWKIDRKWISFPFFLFWEKLLKVKLWFIKVFFFTTRGLIKMLVIWPAEQFIWKAYWKFKASMWGLLGNFLFSNFCTDFLFLEKRNNLWSSVFPDIGKVSSSFMIF